MESKIEKYCIKHLHLPDRYLFEMPDGGRFFTYAISEALLFDSLEEADKYVDEAWGAMRAQSGVYIRKVA